MKRLFFPVIAVLLSACASLLLQSCTVQFVVRPDATPVPYPNAWHIELRVRAQINRVSAGLQQGQLTQDSADVLAANDALVRHFVREYQGPPAEMTDLNLQQTAQLGNMLTDNDRFIDSALQNNQAWDSYFQNGSYDYRSSDHTLYLGYLDYQLNRQATNMKAAQASGSLTPSQAKEIGSRIQTIRSLRQNYYRSNGRFDLTEEQVSQLSQMTEENGGYLRYRTNGSQGSWNKARFNTWKTQAPSGLAQGGNTHWGMNKNNNGGITAASPHQNTQTVAQPPHTDQPKNTQTVAQPHHTDQPRAIDPHASGSTSVPASSPHSLSDQNARPAQLLPTPTMTMSVRKSDQSPAVISTPVLPMPTNTPLPKIQVQAPVPTNTPNIVRKPVMTPPQYRGRPMAIPTRVPVKVKPTPTKVPPKVDQGTQGDSKPSEGDHSDSRTQDDKGNGQGKKPGGPHGD